MKKGTLMTQTTRRRRTGRAILTGAVAAIMAIVAAGCGGGSTSSSSGAAAVPGAEPSKPVTITLWHGQVDVAEKVMTDLVAKFEAANPNIKIDSVQGAQPDTMLTKLTTVLGTDNHPDIAYVFGTDVPALARSAKTVDLTKLVEEPSFGWDDFYEAEREVSTVAGKVVAIPALVDNLAVVYNKAIFRSAGVTEPDPNWTWDDFRATAKQLTNASQKTFGTSYPIGGDEDTVWRFWPMIWQQGAKAISDDGKTATFDDPAFAKALELWRAMTIDDKSVYVDANPDAVINTFAAGKVGMMVTGPFALSDFDTAKIDYGVVQLPAFNDHQTVSGPDTWMVFDNGADRIAGAAKFMQFLTAPEQDGVWSVSQANMPIRNATRKTPEFAKASKENPAFQVFADNFVNAKQKRPQTTVYPAYSLALGEQIAAVLSGQASVADALSLAKQNAEAALVDAG